MTHHAKWSSIPELVNYMQSIPPIFSPVPFWLPRALSFIPGGPDVCGITGGSVGNEVRQISFARDKPRRERRKTRDSFCGLFGGILDAKARSSLAFAAENRRSHVRRRNYLSVIRAITYKCGRAFRTLLYACIIFMQFGEKRVHYRAKLFIPRTVRKNLYLYIKNVEIYAYERMQVTRDTIVTSYERYNELH